MKRGLEHRPKPTGNPPIPTSPPPIQANVRETMRLQLVWWYGVMEAIKLRKPKDVIANELWKLSDNLAKRYCKGCPVDSVVIHALICDTLKKLGLK